MQIKFDTFSVRALVERVFFGTLFLLPLCQLSLYADMSTQDNNARDTSIEAIRLGEDPREYRTLHGAQDNGGSFWSSCLPCCTPPKVEVHGVIRGDFATMDRTPQYGTIIQPATIQIPLDKQKERRHDVTFIDARASSFYIDAYHEICDTKVYGVIGVDFDIDLDFGFAGDFRNSNSISAALDEAYFRADFPNSWYLKVGHTWNLITVTNIAWPLKLPICDLYAPAGMTYDKVPQFKVGAYQPFCYGPGELHYFAGIEQNWLWTGVERNREIALRPVRGEPLAWPVFAAGASWEKWEPLEVDVRFAIGQNRFAIKGTHERAESLGWLGKVSVQSQIFGPTIYGAYSYMDGMNRYALLAFPDSILTDSEEIKNVKGHGIFGGTYFDICGCVNFNVMFGYAWARPLHCTSFGGDMYNRYSTAQVCMWKEFGCHYAAAVEYKRWNVKAINGSSGHLNLFMATLSYYF